MTYAPGLRLTPGERCAKRVGDLGPGRSAYEKWYVECVAPGRQWLVARVRAFNADEVTRPLLLDVRG